MNLSLSKILLVIGLFTIASHAQCPFFIQRTEAVVEEDKFGAGIAPGTLIDATVIIAQTIRHMVHGNFFDKIRSDSHALIESRRGVYTERAITRATEIGGAVGAAVTAADSPERAAWDAAIAESLDELRANGAQEMEALLASSIDEMNPASLIKTTKEGAVEGLLELFDEGGFSLISTQDELKTLVSQLVDARIAELDSAA